MQPTNDMSDSILKQKRWIGQSWNYYFWPNIWTWSSVWTIGWSQDCTCPVLLWNGRHGVPFPIFSSTLYLVPFRIIALIFWNGRCCSLSSLFVEKGPHLFYIEYGILGSTFLDFWSQWGDEVVVEVKHMKIPTGQFLGNSRVSSLI